jgi:hypothetical protein
MPQREAGWDVQRAFARYAPTEPGRDAGGRFDAPRGCGLAPDLSVEAHGQIRVNAALAAALIARHLFGAPPPGNAPTRTKSRPMSIADCWNWRLSDLASRPGRAGAAGLPPGAG